MSRGSHHFTQNADSQAVSMAYKISATENRLVVKFNASGMMNGATAVSHMIRESYSVPFLFK